MQSTYACLFTCLTALLVAPAAEAAFPALESDVNFNTGVGTLVLQFVSGQYNTAFGDQALNANTSGASNTALGAQALLSNSTGTGNTAVGDRALNLNSSGTENTATGAGALFGNTTGTENSAYGWSALVANDTGLSNTAIGYQSMASNISGSYNTGGGSYTLFANTTGIQNTSMGWGALSANTTGSNNTSLGDQSMFLSTIGARNTAIGRNALGKNVTGSGNIALGADAGSRLTTGSFNIDIGHIGVARETKTIRIGTQGKQLKTYVAGVRGATISGGAVVMVSKTGQLGMQTSSRRYKEDIQAMGDASAALLRLKPVTFRYKEGDEQGNKPVQFGLIAEEVAEVLPALVLYDEQNHPETVAYQALSSLLLNEFQKEHARRLAVEAEAQREMAAIKVQAQQASVQAAAAGEALAQAWAEATQREQELVALRAEIGAIKRTVQRMLSSPPAGTTVAELHR